MASSTLQRADRSIALTGACGDVVAAREDAGRLLANVLLPPADARLLRLILTASILEIHATRDSVPASTLLTASRDLCSSAGHAGAMMQFTEYVACELQDMSPEARHDIGELCSHAIGGKGKGER